MTPTSTAGSSTDRDASGFTLFELLIVIAILAISTGMLVPRLDFGGGGGGIDDAADAVRQAMEIGRTRARLAREDVTVTFLPGEIRISRTDGPVRLPGAVRFRRLVFAGEGEHRDNTLVINRRGITSAVIVRMEVHEQLYSLLVSPVIQDIEYRQGTADFSDFAYEERS